MGANPMSMALTAAKRINRNRSASGSFELPASQGGDKLSERVYQALRRDIVTAVLRPGEAVSEKELAARYNSSRTPVREAALRLEEQNLLRNVPNRGYFVTHLTVKDLNDIYEYRLSVECTSAEFAAHSGIPSITLPALTKLASRRTRPDPRPSFE